LGDPNLGLGQIWVWVPKTHFGPFKPLGQTNLGFGPKFGFGFGPKCQLRKKLAGIMIRTNIMGDPYMDLGDMDIYMGLGDATKRKEFGIWERKKCLSWHYGP
jgi:hypothetical protein